jgi:hypothetical protein
MSKVLLVWLITYFGGLALALVHPIYPFMSYLVFYYATPEKNWWGEGLPNMRWSLVASLVMVGSLFLKSSSLERLKQTKNPALPWFLLFGVNVVVVTLWAQDRVRSWTWTVALLKLILLYVIMAATIRTPVQFDMFSAAHIGGATYWGYKGWDDPTRRAGRLKDVGGPDTQNENAAAAHILTVLPFVVVYAFSVKRRTMQALLVVCGGFIVNLLILCNSRGSTLSLLIMGCAAIVLAGKGRRKHLIAVALAGGVMLFALADNRFIARQQTTVEAQDGSAQGRLTAWKAGLRFMMDYPLGTGGRGFHILSPKYIPDIVAAHDGDERSVHDTYLQLAAEWGIQGLILWGGFMTSTLLLLERCRKSASQEPWYFYRFLAVELALIGSLIAGIFTNRLYGESVYWMCSLAFALHRMRETAKSVEAEQRVVSVSGVLEGARAMAARAFASSPGR